HRLGRGLRDGPAAGHHHHRRPAGEPNPHAFDDSGGLHVPGPFPPAEAQRGLPEPGGGADAGPEPGRMKLDRNIRDTIPLNKANMTCHRLPPPASLAGLTALSLVLAGCAVGPDYKRPAAMPHNAAPPM